MTAMALARRDWWTVPVEGLGGINQLFVLESRELLRGAEISLLALRVDPEDYAEQMVLCRAFQAVAAAASSMGLRRLAEIALAGERDYDELLDRGLACSAEFLDRTDARLGQLFAELLDLVGEPVPVAAEADAAPGAGAVDPAVDAVPAPAPAPQSAWAPEPSAAAPWWWASDWSVWERPDEPVSMTEATPAVPAFTAPSESPGMEPMTLRIPAATLREWSEQLAQWQRDAHARHPPRPAEGPLPALPLVLPQIRQLRAELERARLVSLEAWSVGLYRAVRRVARAAGLEGDFDLQGHQAGADAELLQEAMPVIESLLCARVEQGRAALRLCAREEPGLLSLELSDVGPEPCEQPWPDPGDEWVERWRSLGGAWRPLPQGWQLLMPRHPEWLPCTPLLAGSIRLRVPAAWCVRTETVDRIALQDALRSGSLQRADAAWPLLRLSALVKVRSTEQDDASVVFLMLGQRRLALQVEEVGKVECCDVQPWPADLAIWARAFGVWGAVLDAQGQLQTVTDPFVLEDRFGAAARVLSRGRAHRRAASVEAGLDAGHGGPA